MYNHRTGIKKYLKNSFFLFCAFKMVCNTLQFMGKLREEIVTITPPNREDFAEYRLLLTGPVGSGKSSFINTVYSVFSDRIRQPAITGTSAAGVTKQVNVWVTLRMTPAFKTMSYLGSHAFWIYQYHILNYYFIACYTTGE